MTYAEMMSRWSSPMPVVAGPRPKASDRLTASFIGEDAELLARTAHVRLKGECMNEFFSRCGLGKSQILAMSKDQITKFCEIAERNRQDELKNSPYANAGLMAKLTPRALPKKINIGA